MAMLTYVLEFVDGTDGFSEDGLQDGYRGFFIKI